MTKTIVNVAASVVMVEAQNILRTYPVYPYQEAFSAPSLRHKLMVYVLSRMPTLYVVMDECEIDSLNAESSCYCPPQQRQQMTELIHRGIHHVLQEGAEVSDRTTETDPALTPSYWFG